MHDFLLSEAQFANRWCVVTMNHEQMIVLWLCFRRRQREQRNHRLVWMHPINERREEVGLFV